MKKLKLLILLAVLVVHNAHAALCTIGTIVCGTGSLFTAFSIALYSRIHCAKLSRDTDHETDIPLIAMPAKNDTRDITDIDEHIHDEYKIVSALSCAFGMTSIAMGVLLLSQGC